MHRTFHSIGLCSWDMAQLWWKFTVCNALWLGAASALCCPLPQRPHLPWSVHFLQVPAEPAALPAPSYSWGMSPLFTICAKYLETPKCPPSVLPSLWNCRLISAWRLELLSLGVWVLSESRDNNRTSVHEHFFLGRGYIGFIKFSKCLPPPCPLHSSQLTFSECFPQAWHCWKSFAWVVACHYWSGLLVCVSGSQFCVLGTGIIVRLVSSHASI